jgi:glycosyltransferase involved in cell wall biosynthesis
VTLEAMLAGVIVLASPTCGSDDLIVAGETGLLIDPGDPASIAAMLESLAAEPGRAQAIRAQAARFATALAADNCARWRHLLAEQRPAW